MPKTEATFNETLISPAYFNLNGTRCTEHTGLINMKATFKVKLLLLQTTIEINITIPTEIDGLLLNVLHI